MTDRSRLVTVVLAASLAAAACGGPSAAGVGCDRPIREALDPQSGLHLLDPDTIVYLSDPPTSGPHVGAVPSGGPRTEPVPRPSQVALLEAGGVMVQYGPLTDADRAAVEALAGDRVLIAPSDDLDSGEIMATAWLHKLACRSADVEAIQAFVDDRLGALDGHS